MIIPSYYNSMRDLLDSGQLPAPSTLSEPLHVCLRGVHFQVDPRTETVIPHAEWAMGYRDNINLRLLGTYFFDDLGYRPTPDVYTPSPENFDCVQAVKNSVGCYLRHFYESGPSFVVEVQSTNYLVTRPIDGNPARAVPVDYNAYSGLADVIPPEQRTYAMTITAKALARFFNGRSGSTSSSGSSAHGSSSSSSSSSSSDSSDDESVGAKAAKPSTSHA